MKFLFILAVSLFSIYASNLLNSNLIRKLTKVRRGIRDRRVVQHVQLLNGICGLHIKDPELGFQSHVTVAVNAGYLRDPRERWGLTHLLEHLVCRGLVLGGGMTGFERTYYFAKSNEVKMMERWMWQISDKLGSREFCKKEISEEIGVVDAEFKLLMSQGDLRTFMMFFQVHISPECPLSKLPGGNHQSLSHGDTSEYLKKMCGEYYVAEGMSFVFASGKDLCGDLLKPFNNIPHSSQRSVLKLPLLDTLQENLKCANVFNQSTLNKLLVVSNPAQPTCILFMTFALPKMDLKEKPWVVLERVLRHADFKKQFGGNVYHVNSEILNLGSFSTFNIDLELINAQVCERVLETLFLFMQKLANLSEEFIMNTRKLYKFNFDSALDHLPSKEYLKHMFEIANTLSLNVHPEETLEHPYQVETSRDYFRLFLKHFTEDNCRVALSVPSKDSDMLMDELTGTFYKLLPLELNSSGSIVHNQSFTPFSIPRVPKVVRPDNRAHKFAIERFKLGTVQVNYCYTPSTLFNQTALLFTLPVRIAKKSLVALVKVLSELAHELIPEYFELGQTLEFKPSIHGFIISVSCLPEYTESINRIIQKVFQSAQERTFAHIMETEENVDKVLMAVEMVEGMVESRPEVELMSFKELCNSILDSKLYEIVLYGKVPASAAKEWIQRYNLCKITPAYTEKAHIILAHSTKSTYNTCAFAMAYSLPPTNIQKNLICSNTIVNKLASNYRDYMRLSNHSGYEAEVYVQRIGLKGLPMVIFSGQSQRLSASEMVMLTEKFIAAHLDRCLSGSMAFKLDTEQNLVFNAFVAELGFGNSGDLLVEHYSREQEFQIDLLEYGRALLVDPVIAKIE